MFSECLQVEILLFASVWPWKWRADSGECISLAVAPSSLATVVPRGQPNGWPKLFPTMIFPPPKRAKQRGEINKKGCHLKWAQMIAKFQKNTPTGRGNSCERK